MAVPRKVRELIQDLQRAGFSEVRRRGRGSHRSRMKAIDRYHKWVEWSDEDGVYIGRCPDLITGIHGDDPVQVYEELCEVIADVIADFETRGQPLPDPRVRPVLQVQ